MPATERLSLAKDSIGKFVGMFFQYYVLIPCVQIKLIATAKLLKKDCKEIHFRIFLCDTILSQLFRVVLTKFCTTFLSGKDH